MLWITGRYRISKLNEKGEVAEWTADEGGTITDTIITGNNWGLVDDVAQKMWRKITINVNGIPIEDPCSHPYPYRSMFESMTGHDEKPKKNIHQQLMNHLRDEVGESSNSVSYTHLTLPTIYSV